jgi:hypothetical protein
MYLVANNSKEFVHCITMPTILEILKQMLHNIGILLSLILLCSFCFVMLFALTVVNPKSIKLIYLGTTLHKIQILMPHLIGFEGRYW